MIRRTCHRLLSVAAMLALAAVFVPSAAVLPALGNWFDAMMWHHGERASL